MDPLYISNTECPCCATIFEITRVRPSFKNPNRSDTDFCGYYKSGVNPDFYVVRICPACGYSFSENGVKLLSDEEKAIYFDQIGKHWVSEYFHGERTIQEALMAYKRALMIAQLMKAEHRLIAGLLHHIAWLYRYLEQEQDEQRFLQFALEQYIVVYENEENSEKNARLLYIIGELNKRTGQYNEAVKWFSRVVNDKSIMDAGMIRASREQWKDIGEILAQQRASNLS
ncbi:MAG: DUF2225 domain-containing protein [Candidatus Pristimantibacillus lignocellulolyticus]|uniref:DUF2225 domain-containing protein n=1 Tax=Candidatus Pristimantibacillus lignocellulolyticus TaxID=2994561 RepID=A0A9J6ZA48_9BACL|nr:MAG: DUF2225 domain-containing protein [Candidatus Pristimantibacillus lignocellulolyticus]